MAHPDHESLPGILLPARRCPRRAILARTLATLFALGAIALPAAAGESPLVREFVGRRAACDPNDAVALVDLAGWAESRGLPRAAERAYRDALTADPLNHAAYRGVSALAARRGLPTESRALDDARARLPARFRQYETRRFVVLSDADAAWTLEQAQILERTHDQFHRFARRIGLRPLPLRHKLVCVLFDHRRDYQTFATAHDGVVDPWIAGYYAPATDRVVFYRGDTNPSVIAARERLAEMETDIQSISMAADVARRGGRVDRAESLRGHRDRYRRHVRDETRRVDAFANQVSLATTVHEGVHQLLFHCEVQSPRHPYPVWISEGLATAFETDTPSAAFSPSHEHAPRREAFDEMLAGGRLLELRRLVTATAPPADEATVHVVYHQSYALVTWMARFRQQELRRYLELMRAEPAGRLAPQRALAIFVEAFGDDRRLQQAWLEYERDRAGRSRR